MSLSEWAQQVVFGLGLGAIYALVAVGFSLIYRTMGLLSFVHPQYVMLGSVFGYTALTTLHWPLAAAVVPVALVTAAASWLVDLIGLRPIRARRGSEVAMILATIGWGIVLVQLVSHTYGTNALSLSSGGPANQLHVLGVAVSTDTLAILGVGVVIVVALAAFLRRTRAGRALRSVGEDPSTASLMGIDIERTYGLAAAIGGILGGVAGLFVGWLFVGGITAGTIGTKSLAAAVIGGFGSLPGALVGGLALGEIDTLVATAINPQWRDAIVFGLVIAVLLVRPSGLFGDWRFVRA